MYNSNTDSLGLILGVEVFFLLVTVQEHCVCIMCEGLFINYETITYGIRRPRLGIEGAVQLSHLGYMT